MRAGISLGSNLGDRAAHLDAAVRAVTALSQPRSATRVSTYHETSPVDCPPDSGAFLNAAMEIEWSGSPLELLHQLQSIEACHGRPKIRAANSPRPLDLDLLYLGDTRLDSQELTLPHPRLAQREFVLKPLAEICPDQFLRFFGKTISELLQHISS
jgi:2-amino-4-hydroxy-6-hydroxymethyldihydropteridine diphosphokinase